MQKDHVYCKGLKKGNAKNQNEADEEYSKNQDDKTGSDGGRDKDEDSGEGERENDGNNHRNTDTYIVNGNIFFEKYAQNIRINNSYVSLTNTCAYHSITELFVHACRQFEHFQNVVGKTKINSPTDYWNFIFKYAQMGEKISIYELRAYVLFNSRNRVGGYMDCWTETELQFRRIFREGNPLNCFKTRTCTRGCPVVRQDVTFIDPICSLENEPRFMERLPAILEESLTEKLEDCGQCCTIKCCNVKLQLGVYMMIEMEFQCRENPRTKKRILYSLGQIPPTIFVGGQEYRLCGVIQYSTGHFVPYCKSSDGQWTEKDDMKSDNKPKIMTDFEILEPMILNSMLYIKAN